MGSHIASLMVLEEVLMLMRSALIGYYGEQPESSTQPAPCSRHSHSLPMWAQAMYCLKIRMMKYLSHACHELNARHPVPWETGNISLLYEGKM